MPRKNRSKPLYQRGDYTLQWRSERAGRETALLEIVWYDPERKRQRSTSAGTSDVGEGKQALDRLYLKANGQNICPTCGQERQAEAAPLLARKITDYILETEGQAGHNSLKTRLAHVIGYLATTDPTITAPLVDPAWVEGFRKWMRGRDYSPGHIEGCVLQLAAAINKGGQVKARFKADSIKGAARSPVYRADVATLAAMFRFCIDPPNGKTRSEKERQMVIATRVNLLRYLRAAVATWSRPDAIFDLKAKGQWHSAAGVLDLNPPGRRQTKKYRPMIPVARQFRPWLDEALERNSYLPVSTVKHGWATMREHLGLPGGREAGEKLIRRSMATICRKRIGEANWTQGEFMLGHRKSSISDLYAIPDPANIGLALAATESVIDDIEALAPGAFGTAGIAGLKLVSG